VKSYFKRCLQGILPVLLIVVLPARAQTPDKLIETGREIANELSDSIVTVRVVMTIKMSFGGQDRPEEEIQQELIGTVITPDGLTLMPLSQFDPSGMIQKMAGGRANELQVDTRIKDIVLIINKKKEIKAREILRDPDLDIALFKPVEDLKEPMVCIDLDNHAEPALLEKGITLGRLGRVGDREVAVMSGEIQSIIRKPRTFYVPSAELASGGLAVPVFNMAKKLLGFVGMRFVASDANMHFGLGQENELVIILPAADVREMVAQVREDANNE
jgi:hypothetical protein